MKKKTGTESGSLYFLTNQYNLREILAGGFIGDFFTYDDKYYSDYLMDCKGRVPYFKEVYVDQLKHVTQDDPVTTFPVLLEVDAASVLSGDHVIFSPSVADYLVAVSTERIPIEEVLSIIFMEEKQLMEFSVRKYDNMPLPLEKFKVDASMVQNRPYETPKLLNWLNNLPIGQFITTDQYVRVDRTAGALCLLTAFIKDDADGVKYIIRSNDASGRPSRKPTSIPEWLKDGFLPLVDFRLLTHSSSNQLFFFMICRELLQFDNKTINQKNLVLERILDALKSAGLPESDTIAFQKSLSRTKQIINNEADFEVFRTPGYEISKALLLFLLRPRYDELFNWSLSETGASTDIMLTALSFAGLVTGRKSLSNTYKEASKDMEIKSTLLGNLVFPNKEKPTKAKISRTKKGRVKNQQLGLELEQQERPYVVDDESILNRFLDSSFGENEKLLRMEAISYCSERSWDDCLDTILMFKDCSKISLETIQDNDGTLFKFNGVPKIIYDLNVLNFKKRLTKGESA